MTKIVSVVNQKGGVGKTTTVMNVSAALSILEKKVLIIDFDPQNNASSGVGIDINNKNMYTIYNLLTNENVVEDVIINTKIPNLDIIPCNSDLSAAEIELANLDNREFVLKNSISSILDRYDAIFIDCPPSLSLLTINALVASTTIIIPLQCEYFALEGLSHLLDTAERIKENYNNQLNISGIVLTMYDKRNKLTDQIEKDVRGCLGNMVYDTVIPRNVKLSEAPSYGVPAILYDKNCSGSIAYIQLTKEIIKKNKF